MWKTILVGAAALTIAGSTGAFAQRVDPGSEGFRRGAPSTEEMQAFADARLAALKAGLALTEGQAANWPAFERAARVWQKLRIERMIARRTERRDSPAAEPASPAERLRRQGTAMAEIGTAMAKLGEAMDALYKSLDDNQKRRFAALSPIRGPRDVFGVEGGRGEGRRDFRGRDERDSRGGRDFRGRDERDSRGDRFGRDFDGPRDFRGRDERDFHGPHGFRGRDERDSRGDRAGREFDGPRDFRGRDERDSRGDRFGRDFHGPHGFRGGAEDYGYAPGEFGRGPRGRGGFGADDYRR